MMKRKKGRQYKAVVIIAVLAVLLLALCLIGLRLRAGGTKGVVLTTSKVMKPPETAYYLQRGESWSEDKLGSSRFTVGSSGCLITSLASLMGIYGMDVTPGEVNRAFTDYEVYNASGDVIWGNIKKAYPELSVDVKSGVDAAAIEAAVEQGKYPLVKVKYLGDGYWHWVLLIGSDEGGYLCMDPLYEDKKARPLADHGNKVYAWRLITKE